MIWFDNDEMNITPEVAAFLRYAPAPSREPTRALTPEIETPESGPDVITVLGWIIGLITIGVIGFFACIFVLMMIGFVGAVLSGPPGTAATTSSARPRLTSQRLRPLARSGVRSSRNPVRKPLLRTCLRSMTLAACRVTRICVLSGSTTECPAALRQKTARHLSRLAPVSSSNGKTPTGGVALSHSMASTRDMPSSSRLRMSGARCNRSSRN